MIVKIKSQDQLQVKAPLNPPPLPASPTHLQGPVSPRGCLQCQAVHELEGVEVQLRPGPPTATATAAAAVVVVCAGGVVPWDLPPCVSVGGYRARRCGEHGGRGGGGVCVGCGGQGWVGAHAQQAVLVSAVGAVWMVSVAHGFICYRRHRRHLVLILQRVNK